MFIGDGLGYYGSSNKKKDWYAPHSDSFKKKVGYSVYKLNKEVHHVQLDVAELEKVQQVHVGKIEYHATEQKVQNGRLIGLEATQGTQADEITALKDDKIVKDGLVTVLQANHLTQDELITELQAEQDIQDGLLDDLKDANDAQDVLVNDLTGRVTTLEAADAPAKVILVGGGSANQGNVYAYSEVLKSYWPICDDDWDNLDAAVVCRELGFTAGTATEDSEFGDVLEYFIMDEVACLGTESSIFDCPATSGLFQTSCDLDEGAGVVCF